MRTYENIYEDYKSILLHIMGDDPILRGMHNFVSNDRSSFSEYFRKRAISDLLDPPKLSDLIQCPQKVVTHLVNVINTLIMLNIPLPAAPVEAKIKISIFRKLYFWLVKDAKTIDTKTEVEKALLSIWAVMANTDNDPSDENFQIFWPEYLKVAHALGFSNEKIIENLHQVYLKNIDRLPLEVEV
jgi:hypothetical protein